MSPTGWKGISKPCKHHLEGRLTPTQHAFFLAQGLPVMSTSRLVWYGETLLLTRLRDGYSKVVSSRLQRDWLTYVGSLNRAKGYAI